MDLVKIVFNNIKIEGKVVILMEQRGWFKTRRNCIVPVHAVAFRHIADSPEIDFPHEVRSYESEPHVHCP